MDEAQDTLDELKEQQSALLAIEDGVVCADRDGTLASVTYEAGATLIKNTAFASYYDLDTILISVEVSQNDIAKLAVGDTVQVQISGSRMGAIDGTVYSIASEKTSGGSMSNVTYAVIVAVDNTDGTLTTGSLKHRRLEPQKWKRLRPQEKPRRSERLRQRKQEERQNEEEKALAGDRSGCGGSACRRNRHLCISVGK